jgi:hypothetical protein
MIVCKILSVNRITAILFVSMFAALPVAGSEIDSLLNILDAAISQDATFRQRKESRINGLKLLLEKPGIPPEETYSINSRLCGEYLKYNFDSTLHYLDKNLEIAESLDRTDWIYETKFQISRLLTASGMYSESFDILRSVKREELTGRQLAGYYSSYQQVYAEMGMYTSIRRNSRKYFGLAGLYRDSLMAAIDSASNEYLLLYESKLQDEGKLERSRSVNSQLLSRVSRDSPEYAVYAFQRAISYRLGHEPGLEKKYLILSAISDIKAAVKDNVSLTLLAIMLFEENEIDRAYRYINFSLEDAHFYNARLRYVEISKILPLINEAHQVKSSRQQAKLRFYSRVISILAVFLAIAIAVMYYQMRRLSKARGDLVKANDRLNNLSRDLLTANTQLTALNLELSESNHIKEEYIGFFLNMCSTYIDKLEDYRKMVSRKVVSGQYEALFNAIRSTQFIDSELSEFYTNFDHSFLHLFPDFVEQFNRLLLEDERIVPKAAGSLNTELRIFALIRLGITDSSKIASFLRYSVNTIYNYRTRIRNKSQVPRDDFEDMVRKIGAA